MFKIKHKIRRLVLVVFLLGSAAVWIAVSPDSYETVLQQVQSIDFHPFARDVLEEIDVKESDPKTGYSRAEFYSDWPTIDGCNLRQKIIKREFGSSAKLEGCTVLSGEYDEPYTGEHKAFLEKSEISSKIQIDHVVALSDAWQKGAKNQTEEERYNLATDPLNLLAVDSTANQQKSDGDASEWLPSNKEFRCQYVARQISVKYKYHLWVTMPEKIAMLDVLKNCPNQPVVGILPINL